MIVMMSSSFDLERDGKRRSLWGIFLANVHLSVPKGASMAQRYGLIHVKISFLPYIDYDGSLRLC